MHMFGQKCRHSDALPVVYHACSLGNMIPQQTQSVYSVKVLMEFELCSVVISKGVVCQGCCSG